MLFFFDINRTILFLQLSCLAMALMATERIQSFANPYQRLKNVPLKRVSTGEVVTVPSLWKSGGPFGLGREKAALFFMRHYGWVFCWELAVQLQRDLLPILAENKIKLFAVGIGSTDAANELSKGTGFPKEFLLTDDSKLYNVRALNRNLFFLKSIIHFLTGLWSIGN